MHIYCLFFFFASDLLLAVYFIFILAWGNNIRQKANSSDFFYLTFKWVVKQWRQLATSTMQNTTINFHQPNTYMKLLIFLCVAFL